MEHLENIGLVDELGKPLSTRMQQALHGLVPQFRRQFPALRDVVFMTEVFEEAARRIALREERSGPVEKLRAYAWVIVRRIAATRLERPSMAVARRTLAPEQSQAVLSAMRSEVGTPEQIEREILFQETLARLTPEERLLCTYKEFGLDSKEIARQLGTSASRVNQSFFRLKQKVRALSERQASGSLSRRSERVRRRRVV